MPRVPSHDRPTNRPRTGSLRGRVLAATFALLYGPLGFLHEIAGRCLSGPAWHGRRIAIAEQLPPAGRILDLGCGDGRLLELLAPTAARAIGIEPSCSAARRAAKRDCVVICARAQALPFRDLTFDAIVSTYPGPWIVEPAVWDEVARVTRPGGRVVVLLGGDYRHGRFARPRRALAWLAYGRPRHADESSPTFPLGNDRVIGAVNTTPDAWGEAVVWIGVRE